MASVLNEVAGPRGIPIRFAGDEFMILLPGSDADDAGRVAERLLQRARERPFRVRDGGPALPITMSVGIAAAPRDGVTGRAIFEAADTALYHAKHSGRDQTAQAGTVDPARVFPQTALHRLLATRICGRGQERVACFGEIGKVDIAMAHSLSDNKVAGNASLYQL